MTERDGYPCFEDALSGFRALLRDVGMPDELRWVFREDVTGHRWSLCVRDGLGENEDRARDLYEVGVAKGLGLSLQALCIASQPEEVALCYVWAPVDDEAASQAMNWRSLKYGAPQDRIFATTVGSRVAWAVWKRINRWRGESPLLAEIPRAPGSVGHEKAWAHPARGSNAVRRWCASLVLWPTRQKSWRTG